MFMESKIKSIIFDVGGVLALGKNSVFTKKGFRPSGVHEYVAKKLNISMDQYLDSIDTNYALAIEGKISEEHLLKIFSKNMRTNPLVLKKLYVKAYQKNFKQNKQLFKQAFKLQKQGFIVGILSDQWTLSKKALMPEKYYQNFKPVIVSCDVGLRKPNPKIFDLLIKTLKLKPEEIVFIDNQEWNIAPAKSIGIKTILFENNKQLFKQLNQIIYG